MVSRRKILSRSRDELHFDGNDFEDVDEDTWNDLDRLFRDHINEILVKWEQIDDGIWSKIILFERNRRIAKAYARAEVLTINGSHHGFDGYRIGLNGFENPMRDTVTKEIKREIGKGVRMKIDDSGNIAMMKLEPLGVFCHDLAANKADSTLDDSLLKNGGELGDKPARLFVMRKFHSLFKREQRQKYPNAQRLQNSCISAFSLVKNSSNLIKCPCWVLVINMVALEMIRPFINGNLRLSTPNLSSGLYDRALPEEDPYSLPGSGSSRPSKWPPRNGLPPKLPPRDTPKPTVPTPDYDLDEEFENNNSRLIKFPMVQPARKREDPANRLYDDPYYYGFRARVPKFAQRFMSADPSTKKNGFISMTNLNDQRLCYDSGLGDSEVYANEDDYSGIYGRFRSPIYAPLGPQKRPWN